jgi:Tol biopolymer transport system component
MELGSGSYLVRSEDDPSQPIVPNSVALSADTSRIAYYTYGLYPTQSGLGALHILPGLRDSIDLYDMTPDFTTGYLASPEFSPDGRYLAFYGALYPGGNTMLNVIDMENPNATPLSVDAFYGAMQSSSIAWSPSGDSVFFSGLSTPASAYGINVLDVRSGEVSSLSYSSGVDLFPASSPDGRSFAFVRVDATKGSYDIYISTLNGKLRRVTGSGTPKSFPEWSPDGTKLLFIESDPGRLDLHGNLNRLDLHTLQVDTLDQGAYRGFWQSTPATAGR